MSDITLDRACVGQELVKSSTLDKFGAGGPDAWSWRPIADIDRCEVRKLIRIVSSAHVDSQKIGVVISPSVDSTVASKQPIALLRDGKERSG